MNGRSNRDRSNADRNTDRWAIYAAHKQKKNFFQKIYQKKRGGGTLNKIADRYFYTSLYENRLANLEFFSTYFLISQFY